MFIAGLLLIAMPAAAQETTGRFAVRAFGVKVGDMTLAGTVTDTAYAVTSRFVTTGLAGAVAGIRFDLRSEGSRDGLIFRPRLYTEDMNTGERQSRESLTYARGLATSSDPKDKSRDHKVSDADQRGAVDPLTVLFMALRDQPRTELCQIDRKLFDGARLTHVRLTNRTERRGRVTCSGVFTRLAGYSARDLKKGPFKLSVTYEPSGDLMQAVSLQTDTIYGPARIVRR